LLSTADLTSHKTCPGIVRRFWWRTNQQARLAIACLGLLATFVPLATAGAAGLPGDGLAQTRGSAALEAALNRGDAIEVTVYTVSGVDSFEGMEPATGLFFRAQVSGLRRLSDCWLTESRAAAQNLLRGKNARLVVKKDGISGSDRIAVDVQLPDGSDYARTIVHEGVASADLTARGELAPVEITARQERRGLWAAGCAFDEPATASSVPPSSSASSSSSAPVSTTTTTAAPTSASSAHRSSSPSATSSSEPPPDDEWVRDIVGKRCLIEGAKRKSPKGNEVVCARNDKDQLRWRRAD